MSEELKAQEELKASIMAIGAQTSANPGLELARLANQPYDAELPVPEMISEVFNVATVERGEDFDYFTQDPETKVVYTVASGSVTQTNVSPDSENELSFSSYDSAEEYVYLDDLLDGKYDPIAVRTDAQQEVLNRLEIKAVCNLLIAGAVAQSNTYAWDSGDTAITPEKIVEMVRSVAKYGTKVVLITGANVTTDVMMLDFAYNKNREVTLAKLGISKHIALEAFQYTHSGTQTILDADKAIVVAVSDSKANKPGHFVRRKMSGAVLGADVGEKERLVFQRGPIMQVGASAKSAISIVTYERFGAVLVNAYTVGVFKNDTSYS